MVPAAPQEPAPGRRCPPAWPCMALGLPGARAGCPLFCANFLKFAQKNEGKFKNFKKKALAFSKISKIFFRNFRKFFENFFEISEKKVNFNM